MIGVEEEREILSSTSLATLVGAEVAVVRVVAEIWTVHGCVLVRVEG